MKLIIVLSILIIFVIITILFFLNVVNNKRDNDINIYERDNTIDNEYNVYSSNVSKHKKYTSRIPLKIHQTYFKNQMEVQYYETCMINRYMNSDYDYYFYNDNDVNQYIKTHYPEYYTLYQSILPGAYKADLFRYLVLYREGGVYIDCKSSTIVPLRTFIPRKVGFVSFLDRPQGSIQISFIASAPGHPILKKCIEIAFNNIRNKSYGTYPLDITGPQVCGRAFNQLLGKNDMDPISLGYYESIDALIIGSMKSIKGYELLVDHDLQPLVSKACCSYYQRDSNDANSYTNLWNAKKVYIE